MAPPPTVWSTAVTSCTEARPAASCSAAWPDSLPPTCSCTVASRLVGVCVRAWEVQELLSLSPHCFSLLFHRCGRHFGEVRSQQEEEENHQEVIKCRDQSESNPPPPNFSEGDHRDQYILCQPLRHLSIISHIQTRLRCRIAAKG